jgi:two-component system alkaline phosphatase synthesis response regulator PhoP
MSTWILVVDDDPQITRLVRSYLEQAGWQVNTLLRGDEVLPVVRSRRPDLIVLDLMLPGTDGLEVLRTLRSDPALATLPVLLLTARVDDVDRIVGLELGADDYVTKPFNPREVVARVKAILRRTQASAGAAVEPPVQIGRLRIDPAGHRVELGSAPVQLTPSEFAILYLMMRHPGRAFSRAQLVEEALGYDYPGLERTVDSHIKNLRRKLDAQPEQPSRIETVFGVGYRFNPNLP